ncbi:hypothetical protein BJY01DRAFT_57471 [Aspergillus pseudoustus]|uniref:Uncharacterized protein n=1 Tax=Aspergillus pseudoustus TaxID=1810923 RepID=A0ABR4KNE9_9EURO
MAQRALDMLGSIFEPRPENLPTWPEKKIVSNPFVDTVARTSQDQEGPSTNSILQQIKADEALAKKLAMGPWELPAECMINEPRVTSAQVNKRSLQGPQARIDQVHAKELADGGQELPFECISNKTTPQVEMQRASSGITHTQSLRGSFTRTKERAPLPKLATDDHETCMKKIDKQLTEHNAKLQWRNQETREAYECFKKLMIEYRELKAENGILWRYHQEDTAAIEGLHGTLAAFQDSITTWMKHHSSVAKGRQLAAERLLEQSELESMSLDKLSDDVKGFMNGWNDAKVEFNGRIDARKRPGSIRRKPVIATNSTNPRNDV